MRREGEALAAILTSADVRRRGATLAALARSIETVRCAEAGALDGSPLDVYRGDVELAPVPASLAAPDLLGVAYQALLARPQRRQGGVFYTPRATAERLVEAATHGWAAPAVPAVCDPACGGGAFLLAVGRWLEGRGLDRRTIVRDVLHGIDLDPLAVAVADAALRLWAAGAGGAGGVPRPRVAVADALHDDPFGDRQFDLVVGNPPFQSQLRADTSRSRDQADRLRREHGHVAAYTDTAALFLAAWMGKVAPGGRAALVMPMSFLAARDARPCREALHREGALVAMWMPQARLFDAGVDVCVPVLERGALAGPVQRWTGAELDDVGIDLELGARLTADTWAPAVASVMRLPELELAARSTVGSLASATAGFRDQFYGLVPFVRERDEIDGAAARLVTSGRIEPGRLELGSAVKFAGSRFCDPFVDLEALARDEPQLFLWGTARLRPKVLVAAQTRVVEAVADVDGTCWPSVPVVSVECDAESCWPLAAVLNSPVATLWALHRSAGTALSRDAIKLSATQVLAVPLPTRSRLWDLGVERLRDAAGSADDPREWAEAMRAYGAAMCEAYGVDDADVLDWWTARLRAPRRRR